jgi:hypothetical protein
MSRLRRLTREGHRQLIEDMAVTLIGVDEIGSDVVCAVTLLTQGFHSRDIADCLNTAREMARAALRDEAGLWDRLMR